MVAELAKPLKPARPKPAFGPGSPIPISTKLTVRSFYLLQGLKPSQIAPMVGLSAQQVANLAIREGWSKQRTAKKAEKESRALERQDARAEAEIDQIQRAIATRTEELSVKTLDHCAEILKSPAGSEKELQMASGAAMNFVKIARMSRGLDQRQSERNGAGDQLSVNLFVVRGEPVESAAKKVEPVEIVATALSTT